MGRLNRAHRATLRAKGLLATLYLEEGQLLTTFPPVTPAVLRWARTEARRMSSAEAATKLKVSEAQLAAFESGDESPNLTVVRRMCSVYQIHFAAILMPEPPSDISLPVDYRTVGGSEEQLSIETMSAIRDSIEKRSTLSDILALSAIAPRLARLSDVTINDDPDQLGAMAREQIGFSAREQLAWKDVRESFNNWRDRLETLGVYTFVQPMPRRDCRGFSLCDGEEPPVIVVNSTEVPQARIFTLFHEYAHVLLRESALCSAVGREPGVERFCNRFAGSVVMPRGAVSDAIAREAVGSSPTEWTLDEVGRVARRLKVGRPALAIRLADLGYSTGSLYSRVSVEWDEESWRAERTSGQSSGGPKPEVRIVNQWGVSFSRTVLRALDRGTIGEADACAALGARTQHLAGVYSFLAGRTEHSEAR